MHQGTKGQPCAVFLMFYEKKNKHLSFTVFQRHQFKEKAVIQNSVILLILHKRNTPILPFKDKTRCDLTAAISGMDAQILYVQCVNDNNMCIVCTKCTSV